MTQDIVQTLVNSRVETEVDVEEWADRLVEAGLLTEREAEALVGIHFTHLGAEEIAQELDVSASRVYNLKSQAETKLREADHTLRMVEELREETRPDPYK